MNNLARFMANDLQFWGLITLFVVINCMGFYYLYRAKTRKEKHSSSSSGNTRKETIGEIQRALKLLRESDKNLPQAEKIFESISSQEEKKQGLSTQGKRLLIELERKIEAAQSRLEVAENRARITEKFMMDNQENE